MIKVAAVLILAACALGTLAVAALDTALGKPTWFLLALALFALDAAWKWFRKQRVAAKARAAKSAALRAAWDADLTRANIRFAERERAHRA